MFGDWLTPVAYAQDGAATTPAGGGLMSIVMMFLAIGVIWWLMMIRPQQKREQGRKAMIAALRKGDEIVTAGGIYARIFAVDEDAVTVTIGKDVRVKLDKSAIVARLADKEDKEGADK
jgi:preprotein translocase subunit YajC